MSGETQHHLKVPGSPPPDAALLSRAYQGDRAAFTLLVERHLPGMLRYARSLCRTPEAAEDAVQQAMLSIWRTIKEGHGGKSGDASVRAWMFTVVRNAVYRLARRRVGEPEHTDDLETLGAQAGWGVEEPNPEAMGMMLEDRARLRAALERLSSLDQDIILLRDVEELTGEETAEILGLPLSTMKTRLHRARLRLRAAVQKEVAHAR